MQDLQDLNACRGVRVGIHPVSRSEALLAHDFCVCLERPSGALLPGCEGAAQVLAHCKVGSGAGALRGRKGVREGEEGTGAEGTN